MPKPLCYCVGAGDDLSPAGSFTVYADSHFNAFPFTFSRQIVK